MTKMQNTILAAIPREAERIAATHPAHYEWAALQRRDNAELGIVPIDFGAWLGRPLRPHESSVMSRCLRRLEELGRVERLEGRRVRLVTEGER